MKPINDPRQWPATPFPNSYWVEPGRLLAGEHPATGSRSDSTKRLEALLKAGITSFINLTGEGELPAYHQELARQGIVHQRFPIVDHAVPSSPETMTAIVAAVDAELTAGRKVYLHCRAGIGRTGMAVGCYLIHRGLDNTSAMDRLQLLWQRCGRSSGWPTIPETEEQIRFVRNWSPAGGAASSLTQRAEGALLGLAIGEGLARFTIQRRLTENIWLTETLRADKLEPGADTAMTCAVAESLLKLGKHDAHDQLTRYVAWTQQPGNQPLVPAELKRVLAAWQWSRKASPGSHDPQNLDAHTLARTLAPVLFSKGDVFKAAELAAEVSRPTLQSPLVLDACRLWAATLATTLNGAAKAEALTLRTAHDALRKRPLKPPLVALLKGDWTRSEPPDGAISTIAAALDAFRSTNSFDTALRESMHVSSTCAALVGSLAGAHYGIRALPPEWVRALAGAAALRELVRRSTT